MLAGGCGGGDSGTSATAGTSSTAQGAQSLAEGRFLLSAGAICAASWARMMDSYEHYSQQNRANTSGKLFAKASQEIFLPEMFFWPDDIGYLAIPTEDAKQVKEMLASMERAVERGREQRISSPQQFAAIFAQSSRLARHYGLHNCTVAVSSFEL